MKKIENVKNVTLHVLLVMDQKMEIVAHVTLLTTEMLTLEFVLLIAQMDIILMPLIENVKLVTPTVIHVPELEKTIVAVVNAH